MRRCTRPRARNRKGRRVGLAQCFVVVWNLNYFSDDSDPNSLYSLWTPIGMRPAYDALRAVLKER